MRSRSFAASVALVAVSACHDSTAPIKPASIAIVAGSGQQGVVGQRLPTSATFVVSDERGRAISGVGVTVTVTAGNGTIADAPRKSAGGPTSVGAWTLGLKTGINQLTVTVNGLPPIVFEATATAGAAAKLVPATATTFTARAGDVASPAPTARVVDSFSNPVAGATVHASLVGGGTASQTLVADDAGNVTVADWTLGPKVGQDVLTLSVGTASLSFIANKGPSDPAKVVALSGDAQAGMAGAPLAAPILVRVTDRFGNTVFGQSATFSVASGGGVVASESAAPNADGAITVPSWTLGRTALPQIVHVTAAGAAGDVSASVQTDYHIDVRFFGPEMTDAQKALFTNAAARVSAIVTGDVPDVLFTNFDVANTCGVSGLPVLNETLDDLVIYASVQDIDGAGKILAQAGPCAFRNRAAGYLTTVGVMELDVADIDRMAANGTLQDVIIHEMLHVVGIGTLWSAHDLLQGEGTSAVTYLGVHGTQGCLQSNGLPVCGGGVPVENNGVPGTTDSHWRETTFRSELMTGFVNQGGMPLSAITVGSLQDLGYTVNPLAADPFTVPPAGASGNVIPATEGGWERPLPLPAAPMSPAMSATKTKRP